MTLPHEKLIVACVLALSLVCPQVSSAQSFIAQDMLEWTEREQDNYIRIAVAMASTIAGQNGKATGDCVNNWYYQSTAVQAQRNDEVRFQMRKASGFHPASVILAMIYQECGKF